MKTKLVMFFLLCTCTLYGQSIKVKKHYSAASEYKGKAFYPVFNPDGTKLLFTSGNYRGLNLCDLQTNEVKMIADNEGAGFSPSFSKDSKKIYYRQVSRKEGRQYKTLMSFDAISKKNEALSEPVRTTKELTVIQKRAMKRGSTPTISVSTENLKIVLYRDGKKTEMEPVGKVAGYIWTSLSPNGKMILFTAASKGTFVCDLSGKIIASLGKMNAPVWYDNNYVVGMEDKDNGDFVVSSKIIMASIDGKVKQTLTSDDKIAMYPAASSTAKRIAYCTLNGDLYVMEIEINQ